MKTTIPEVSFSQSRRGGWGGVAALVLAAGIFLPGSFAHAMIMTTWKLPENEKAINAENTNTVALLSVRRMLDGLMVVYRTDAPDSLAASAENGLADSSGGGLSVGFIDDVALSGFALVRSAGASRAAYNFHASDQAETYIQEGQTEWGGSIGYGEGWGRWGRTDCTRDFFTDESTKKFFRASGDGATVRGFQNGAQLDAGEFSVEAQHGYTDTFSGFAVYGADSSTDDGYRELLRWGVTTDVNGDISSFTGFCTALYTDGQNIYTFFGDQFDGDTQQVPVSVEYTLAWSAIENGLKCTVTASGLWESGGEFSFTTGSITVHGVTSVAAVGVLVTSNSQGKSLLFNDINVDVIPEPGTAYLLLLGGGALLARRKRGADGAGA